MDTARFIIHIKTKHFYKDIANDVEKWLDTSKHDENDKSPPPMGKKKKVIGLFIEFIKLRVKTYAYLIDDDSEHKKAKGTRNCVIKKKTYG